MKSGGFFEARESYTAASAIDKTNRSINLTLLYNRSSANFKLERFKETVEDCTEVLKLNETHVKALARRAQSHYRLKEFEDCIIDSEEAQRLEPSEEMKKRKIFNSSSKGQKQLRHFGSFQDCDKRRNQKSFPQTFPSFSYRQKSRCNSYRQEKVGAKVSGSSKSLQLCNGLLRVIFSVCVFYVF